ncbi:hypothetical protein ECANGB1_1882 [Enterospora canceri]|uniref:Uncharacterized protein n=1 Tax=Enterospora canceri TaxID=1081671 RepID=A0A1Y1S921_9MICR|nr:hypothetical protein ECANGB1_1882 [Enterospora canceri]
MFGESVAYYYGNVFRSHFIAPDKRYRISGLDMGVLEESGAEDIRAVGRVNQNNEIELFNCDLRVVNTFVIGETDQYYEVYGTEGIKTVIEKPVELRRNKMYLCTVVGEKDEMRILKLVKNGEKKRIPGTFLTGELVIKEHGHWIKTAVGSGPIQLQSNREYKNGESVTAILNYACGNKTGFVETNNPIRHSRVNVVATRGGIHWVESGNVRGIVLETEDTKNKNELVVKVEKVRLGHYVFRESGLEIGGRRLFRIVGRTAATDCFLLRIQKTKEKLKARVIGDHRIKQFRGSIVDYDDTTDLYLVEIEKEEEREEAANKSETNKEVLDEIRESLLLNNYAVFAKYDSLLYTDVEVLFLFLSHLLSQNKLDLEDISKYLPGHLKNENTTRKLAEIRNKPLREHIFRKTGKKSAFLALSEMLSPAELREYCKNRRNLAYLATQAANSKTVKKLLDSGVVETEEQLRIVLSKVRDDSERATLQANAPPLTNQY